MYWRGIVEYGVDAVASVFHCDIIMGEDVFRDPVLQLRASRVKLRRPRLPTPPPNGPPTKMSPNDGHEKRVLQG